MLESNKARTITISLVLAALLIGSSLGYWLGSKFVLPQQASGQTLRISNYNYVSPVLFSDFGNDHTSPSLEPLERQLKSLITSLQSQGAITDTSIYYRQLNSGQQIVI